VKFLRAVNALVTVVIDEQVRDVVDHHELLERIVCELADRVRHRRDRGMIGADGFPHLMAKVFARVAGADGSAGIVRVVQTTRASRGEIITPHAAIA